MMCFCCWLTNQHQPHYDKQECLPSISTPTSLSSPTAPPMDRARPSSSKVPVTEEGTVTRNRWLRVLRSQTMLQVEQSHPRPCRLPLTHTGCARTRRANSRTRARAGLLTHALITRTRGERTVAPAPGEVSQVLISD